MELVAVAAGILVLAATIGLPLWLEKSPTTCMAISGLAVVVGTVSAFVAFFAAFFMMSFRSASDPGLPWYLMLACGAGAAVGGAILFVVSVVVLVLRLFRKTRRGAARRRYRPRRAPARGTKRAKIAPPQRILRAPAPKRPQKLLRRRRRSSTRLRNL